MFKKPDKVDTFYTIFQLSTFTPFALKELVIGVYYFC